jgi:uncharacterized protein YmfQ (DUF2313 family)
MFDAVAYTAQLQALLPTGAAWPRDPDAQLTKLVAGLAEEFARVDGRAARLLDEADPRTALELLPEWERLVGLPDKCIPVTGSVRERQLAVASKVAGLGGQSRAYYINLAGNLGFVIEIEEFAPASVAGNCDDYLYSSDWSFAWRVSLTNEEDESQYSSAWGTVSGGCDERIRHFGSGQLECLIRRAAPAHTVVLFAYPEEPEPLLWFDFLNP